MRAQSAGGSAQEQAADWLVALTATDPHERERARIAFEAWKAADPRHAAAAAPMERLLGGMQSLRHGHAAGARAALRAGEAAAGRGTRRRRALATGIMGVLLAALVAAPLWRSEWPQSLAADLRTAPGEWRTQRLPDGSLLTLAGGSAVDLHFDRGRRQVRLLRGDVLVDVAPDAARPFEVRTRDGEIRALGTRFVVRREADATRLAMIESVTAVRPDQALTRPLEEAVRVHAGEQVRIRPDAVQRLPGIEPAALVRAWSRHEWAVVDMPLTQVLEELGRHRAGRLGYDASALAALRVSAVLPLDDTDRALALLQASFPQLKVHRVTAWWVQVGTAD